MPSPSPIPTTGPITGLSPVLVAQLCQIVARIEGDQFADLTPERAAIRLRAIADGLAVAVGAQPRLAEVVAGLASRPLLVMAAAVAIAAINAHDCASREEWPR